MSSSPSTAAPPGRREREAASPRRTRRALTGIRSRILLAFIGLLALATVASILIAREVLDARLDERIDGELQQEVSELRKTATGIDPATGDPFARNVRRLFTVYFATNAWSDGEAAFSFVDGAPYLRSRLEGVSYRLDQNEAVVARWENLVEPQRDHVDTPVGEVDYLAVPLKGDGKVLGTFVAAQFRDLQKDPFNEAYLATGAVGLAVLLIGSLLAWRMAESVLRPVRSVTETARSISESDLTQRIDVNGHDEIARLSETLNAMLDRLERAFSSQRRFLDDAGHELRTPITIVRGHLELLEEDPDERDATLALVLDELDRMSRMVNELILLAKAERPDFLRTEVVAVAPFTAGLHDKARALAPRDWSIDVEGRGKIVADRQRLTEAVMQLAQNAVEHTSESETIALGSSLDGAEARFWVRDEGPGIPIADQATIFERFERRAPRSNSGGFGLGLSIVRAIAEAHGGRVELESEPGRGALFTVVVPVEGPPRSRAERR